MSDLNGTKESDAARTFDQIRDVIQSMIALVLEQGKMHDRRHEAVMAEIAAQRAEIQALITLQREQRKDIRALFQGAKELKEMWAASVKGTQ